MGGLPLRLLKGSGALVLTVLAGCGGRSSTLEGDAVTVDANQPTGGSTSTPSSGGAGATGSGATGSGATGSGATGSGATGSGATGSSATGKAGSSSGGTAGLATPGGTPAGGAAAGGSTGIDQNLLNSCNRYCSVATQPPCPRELGLKECVTSCVSEVGAQSPVCQSAASSLISCLVTAYQNSKSCADFDQLSFAKCEDDSRAYSGCTGIDPGPAPTPTPAPPPTPAQTCSSSGSSSNGACSLDVKCNGGWAYSVSCYQANPVQSRCSCTATSANGAGFGSSFDLNESTTLACYDSLAACGFPESGVK